MSVDDSVKKACSTLTEQSVVKFEAQSVDAVANSNLQSQLNTICSSKASSLAKTIPVLINTANGKQLANVPVTSLLSATTSLSAKPLTYLVMPPQAKGTSLLVPQSAVGKSHMTGLSKFQYILQEDRSGVLKNNTAVTSPRDISGLQPKKSETWALLATVNHQNTSKSSKTVPLLIKSPSINSSLSSAIIQNSVVLSSRAPQSLIPKLVTSQASSGTSVFHQNLVLASNRYPAQFVAAATTDKTLTGNKDSILNTNMLFSSQNSLDDISEDSDTNLSDKLLASSTGRSTPIAGRITPLHSLDTKTSAENVINIKITGSKVTRADDSRPRRASTNIGKFGALSASWNDFAKTSSASIGTRSHMSSPIVFGSATASPTSSLEPWSPLSLHIKSDSELDTTSDSITPFSAGGVTSRAASVQSRRRAAKAASAASGVDLSAIKSGLVNVGRLHPLIDHDYGSFKEFNAEIQSSIIATTESKQKIEKYNQKAKAQRSKETLFKLDKNFKQFKKRRYGHRGAVDSLRKARHEKLVDRSISGSGLKQPADELSFLNLEQKSKSPLPPKTLRASRRASQSALERRTPTKMRTMPRRDSKSYVKITGSYQDDFVYYATKHSRGRARKESTGVSESLPLPKPAKKPSVCGVNVFDWYRDLSQTDKSTRFGVPESPIVVQRQITDTTAAANQLKLPLLKGGGTTPVHESDVADLVMAMLPHDEFAPHPDLPTPDFNEATEGPSALETIVTTEVNNESGTINEVVMPESRLQQEQIDQVLSRLLNSMGESELDMIAEKLENDMPCPQTDSADTCVGEVKSEPMDYNTTECKDIDTKPTDLIKQETGASNVLDSVVKTLPEIKIEPGMTSTNDEAVSDLATCSAPQQTEQNFVESTDISALLGPYTQGANLSQVSASFDLDDINDDLLQSDIANMNALIGDLASTNGASITASVENKFTSPPSNTIENPVKTNTPLNDTPKLPPQQRTGHGSVNQLPLKAASNLFPAVEVSRTFTNPSPVQRPPELIVVSMFWNDLPGLLIDDKQCVRLVDIHKQMLPAKDTGILKKRCQMMGLEIDNCCEMEREFLIRYANAAKSKSCVVVTKDDAEALVNFYVNPRPRTSAATNPRLSSTGSRDSSTEKPVTADSRLTLPSGASTPSTESEFDYEVSRYASGKGKGKGKGRPHNSCDKASTPSISGKTKRKQSPLAAPPPPPAYIPSSLEGAAQAAKPLVNTFHTIPDAAGLVHTAQQSPGDPSIKRSNRTRNRKVNYAALNAGIGLSSSEDGENQYPVDRTSLDTFDEETRSAHESMEISLHTEQQQQQLHNAAINNNTTTAAARSQLHGLHMRLPGSSAANLDQEKYSFVEELEIRKLRNKQKRKGLNNTERRKLKQLKARLTLKVKKFKKKLDRLRKNNGSQLLANKNFLVKKAFSDVSDSGCDTSINTTTSAVSPAKSILLPSLKKTVEDLTSCLSSASSQLLPQEALVVKTKQDTKDVEFIDPAIQSQFVQSDTIEQNYVTIHEALAENQALLAKRELNMSDEISDVTSQQSLLPHPHARRTSSRERRNSIVSAASLPRRVGERDRRPSERERERRSSEMSPLKGTERERRISESANQVKGTSRERRLSAGTPPNTTRAAKDTDTSQPHLQTAKKAGRIQTLPVLHRSSQRARSQYGTLNLSLYRSREAACVQCDTCSEYLTVRGFLKHMHNQYGDEMIVRLGQKFELALTEPQPEQLKLWQKFESKREQMDRSFERNKISLSRSKTPVATSPVNTTPTKVNKGKVLKPCDVMKQTAGVRVNTPAAQSALIRQSSVVITPLRPSQQPMVSPCPSLSPDMESPSCGTRHSSRTRKRKQLHPMESYVYTSTTSPNQDSDVKRQRFDDNYWQQQVSTSRATVTHTTTAAVTADVTHAASPPPPPPQTSSTTVTSSSASDTDALKANLAQTKSVVEQVAAISSVQEIER